MLKKTVTYIDFNDNERTEELHFNLTQTELAELAMELPDGVSDVVGNNPNEIDQTAAATKLIETLGGKGVFDFIKRLLIKSYGIKSPDGRIFEKSEAIATEFSQTAAFDAIFMELMSDDNAAAAFVSGVIPSNVADKMNNAGQNPALPMN